MLLEERLDAFGVLLYVAVSTEGHEVVARSASTTRLHMSRVTWSGFATGVTGQGADPFSLGSKLFFSSLSL